MVTKIIRRNGSEFVAGSNNSFERSVAEFFVDGADMPGVLAGEYPGNDADRLLVKDWGLLTDAEKSSYGITAPLYVYSAGRGQWCPQIF